MLNEADFIVLGAGMAGASVAAQLAATSSVILLERESRPGYHSTGRSAALFSEIYGNPVIRALTRASRPFLFDPPADFTSDDLVRPRGSLFIATAEQMPTLQAFAALPDVGPATRALSVPEALNLCPALRANALVGALLEPGSSDLDVAALHQAYLRLFHRRGGRSENDRPVESLRYDGTHWHVDAGVDTFSAPVIVNAAGAWADEVAARAGIAPLGLKPHRRTALLIEAGAWDSASWPMVIDAQEQFYFKPDSGRLLVSPADETPVDAYDAQAEEWDVAVAIDRMETATTLQCNRITHRWAGLRTFAPDRTPVVGFDAQAAGFFWLAGQGGYGIQTAPALARVAAALAQRLTLPPDLLALGLQEEHLSPARFARASGL